MIDKEAYILRISQASPVGLVVINFELIREFLQEALQSEDKEIFRSATGKAKDGLDKLIQSLNFEIPVSHDFYEIYRYSYKLLSDVCFSTDTQAAFAAVKEVDELMEMLLTGWKDVLEKEVLEKNKTDETTKVYTGLTYGRDGSANEYIEENNDRGYMA